MSVLGTTVFKVPKLGETGFKIDQVNEQKKAAARNKIEKQVAATGAEKAYMENAMGLTGLYKQSADSAYQAFRESAIEYEKTGSAGAEEKMKQSASQLNFLVGAGRTILDGAGKEFLDNKANGFKNVAMSGEEASALYTGFANRKGDIKLSNGIVMIKDGDKYVPATQSTYFQSSVNVNNSFMLPRVIKQGTYVNTSAFVNEYKGAISAGTSVEDAKLRMLSLLNNKIKDLDNPDNKAFMSDIITSYAINKLGMVEDPAKLSSDKYDEIQKLSSDEEIVADAVSWYKNEVLSEIPPLWKATSRGGFNFGIDFGGGTDYDATLRENASISVSTVDEQGNASSEEYKIDAYLALNNKMQVKGISDALSGNKYNVTGIGVVVDDEGQKVVAQRQVAEGSDFFQFGASGKKYKTYVSELDIAEEWDRIPPKAKLEIMNELKNAGYDPAALGLTAQPSKGGGGELD